MSLLTLFLVFLKIGLLAIGGAYSFLPLMERELVVKYGWLTQDEFLEILGMVRIFPGAISIKFATYVGYRVAGIPGMVMANMGNFLGPAAIILLISHFYLYFKDESRVEGAFKMIQLAVFAMIISMAFQILKHQPQVNFVGVLVIMGSFLIFYLTKLHPAFIIVGAGVVGAFLIH